MSDRYVSAALRRLVIARAGDRCEYCGVPADSSPSGFCVDHILPSSRGGITKERNLALSCGGCNAHKAGKTHATDPATRRPCRLFHPRRDSWVRHFAWSSDSRMIVGISSIGRTTVDALKLNRASLQNLRSLMKRALLHPP